MVACELDGVSVQYLSRHGDTVQALERVDLAITAGSFISITGPSGSGKSTLLMTLGGMLAPQEGRVLIDGEDLYRAPLAKRAELRNRRIGFVFQTFQLIPYLTAAENVELPLALAGRSEARQRERAGALLHRVGLQDRVDHLPSELSVGQQQRVALARMLANDPQIILADEPTGSLDPQSAGLVLDFLTECHRDGRTVVLVTHDPAAAARAQTGYRLENGVLEVRR